MSYGNTQPDNGLFATGRIVTLAAVLLVAGMAVPSLKDGAASSALSRLTSAIGVAAAKAPGSSRLLSVKSTAKGVATRSRMKGIKQELRLWARQHGMPQADDLAQAVGAGTAIDAWGRPLRFQPPEQDHAGWISSLGPDGRPSADDITMSVLWNDLR